MRANDVVVVVFFFFFPVISSDKIEEKFEFVCRIIVEFKNRDCRSSDGIMEYQAFIIINEKIQM